MRNTDVINGMKFVVIIFLKLLTSCNLPEGPDEQGVAIAGEPVFDSSMQMLSLDSMQVTAMDSVQTTDTGHVNTGNVTPGELLAFAEKQLGVRYRYASTNPAVGFDCSGFITYVFNHFHIKVPRSSIDFTDVGTAVSVENARRGDLILFTGTDSSKRIVGHMGIVQSTDSSQISFIHSSSGKANGVTITPLNKYYQGRFMSIRRVFAQNDRLPI